MYIFIHSSSRDIGRHHMEKNRSVPGYWVRKLCIWGAFLAVRATKNRMNEINKQAAKATKKNRTNANMAGDMNEHISKRETFLVSFLLNLHFNVVGCCCVWLELEFYLFSYFLLHSLLWILLFFFYLGNANKTIVIYLLIRGRINERIYFNGRIYMAFFKA